MFKLSCTVYVHPGCDSNPDFNIEIPGQNSNEETAKLLPPPCTFEWLSPISDSEDSVFAFTNWDPDGPGPQPPLLVAGGHFRFFWGDVDLESHVAFWNGNTWQFPRSGPTNIHDPAKSVLALTVFNGELIAGGMFDDLDGTATSNIARWDGTNWQPLGSGLSGLNSFVRALTVYQGKLIAAGHFDHAGETSVNHIAQWDGASWQALGTGVSGQFEIEWTYTLIRALSVYKGNLIAGGNFMTAGGVSANGIAQWDGISWHPLGSGMDGSVFAMTVYDQPGVVGISLIAGGLFTTAGGATVDRIARWTGGNWESMGGVGGYDESDVSTLIAYNNHLIAGGSFNTAGGITAYRIAQFQFTDNGFIWGELEDGLFDIPIVMTAYHGDLVMSTVNGHQLTPGMARWGPTNPSPPNISRQPKSSNIAAGNTTVFSVTASGCPAPAYQWRKDGVPLEDSARLQGSQSSNLLIDDANTADAGSYDCILNNGVGEITSSVAKLRVR
jgi:hypothetical protein